VSSLALFAGLLQLVPGTPGLAVSVDSARHTVTLEYIVPADAGGGAHEHAAGAHAHHAAHIERMERLRWPVSGWLRGVRLTLLDPRGEPLPQARIHHANLINFSRGQLAHPGVERLWGAGRETEPALLPRSIGVPLDAGTELGLVIAYVPTDLAAGSRVRVEILWLPSNQQPRPIDVLPASIGVRYRVGGTSAYDLPVGRSEEAFEFDMPLDARLLGAGGHLHDYGAELRLEEAMSGRVLVRLRSVRDSLGRLERVERRLFGVSGAGKAMKRGVRYRLVAVYDNPTGRIIPDGAMGNMALALAPRRLSDWPARDSTSDAAAVDLRHLLSFETEPGRVSRAR
jgi:hypothetical protein